MKTEAQGRYDSHSWWVVESGSQICAQNYCITSHSITYSINVQWVPTVCRGLCEDELNILLSSKCLQIKKRHKTWDRHKCLYLKEACDKLPDRDTQNLWSNSVISLCGPRRMGHRRSRREGLRRWGPTIMLGIIIKGAYSKYLSNVEKRDFPMGEKSFLTRCRSCANINVL